MYVITSDDRKFNPYQYKYLLMVVSQRMLNDIEFLKSCYKEKDNTSARSDV